MSPLDTWIAAGLVAGAGYLGMLVGRVSMRSKVQEKLPVVLKEKAPWCWKRQPPGDGSGIGSWAFPQPMYPLSLAMHDLDRAAAALSIHMWRPTDAETQVMLAEHHLARVKIILAETHKEENMKIESTLDKLLITERELQEIVKAHILKETGRKVANDVEFTTRSCNTTAWCRLQAGEAK